MQVQPFYRRLIYHPVRRTCIHVDCAYPEPQITVFAFDLFLHAHMWASGMSDPCARMYMFVTKAKAIQPRLSRMTVVEKMPSNERRMHTGVIVLLGLPTRNEQDLGDFLGMCVGG